MAEYTPRTQDIKNCYVYAGMNPDGSTVAPERVLRSEFNRWLAAHDATVKAGALREAAEDFQKAWPVYGDDWLRARADQIEKGERS